MTFSGLISLLFGGGGEERANEVMLELEKTLLFSRHKLCTLAVAARLVEVAAMACSSSSQQRTVCNLPVRLPDRRASAGRESFVVTDKRLNTHNEILVTQTKHYPRKDAFHFRHDATAVPRMQASGQAKRHTTPRER